MILPLNIDEVNFSDVGDIAGSAELILAGASGSVPFKSTSKTIAKEWIHRADSVLDSLSNGDSITVLGYYEPLHQLAFNQNASILKLNEYRLKAFNSYIRGDKSVNRYKLRNTISREIDRRNPKFLGKPLQWESVCIDRWYRQFQHGVSLDELSDYDTINRVTSLLTSDLWAFETRNESRYKQNLFENHRHYLESIHNATLMHNAQCIMHNDRSDYELCIMHYELTESIMHYELTNALQSFLLASAPYITPAEYTAYDTQIRTALYNHPATNRFQKASLAITLSN